MKKLYKDYIFLIIFFNLRTHACMMTLYTIKKDIPVLWYTTINTIKSALYIKINIGHFASMKGFSLLQANRNISCSLPVAKFILYPLSRIPFSTTIYLALPVLAVCSTITQPSSPSPVVIALIKWQLSTNQATTRAIWNLGLQEYGPVGARRSTESCRGWLSSLVTKYNKRNSPVKLRHF